jgi:hypothetical protein
MVLNVGENSGLNKKALFSDSYPTSYQFGTLFLSNFDIVENLIELLLRNNCSLLAFGVKGVTNFDSFCNTLGRLKELCVNRLMNKSSRSCNTALAVVAKQDTGLFGSKFDISVW